MKKLYQILSYQLPHLLQKALHKLFLLFSIVILVFCRDISGYLSNYDTALWFYYFTIVERVSMLLLLLSVFKRVKKISWITGELLFCFLLQDILDRTLFNFREIGINDYITIGILIIISIIKYKNDNTRKNSSLELV